MKRITSIIVGVIVATGLMAAGSVFAADTSTAPAVAMPEAARKLGCGVCHEINRKVIGPAWMEVSKKYKGATTYKYSDAGSSDATAKEYPLVEGLMMKVTKGGRGNWGAVAMIANDPGGTKQADIKNLVEFVLGLAK